ncbi:hypothetical protein [Secundilactobacillus kimchicus]|uniref:VRR-NUC domain-containing protein n=1 Tax=Secundilactobacillus kimchicus JCM 15530 TaxID=1302272 RepID=A0A0R1HQ89_9LACO|nr:hypothetical protein [Secundilactobacillus kimchicus]KRK49022.1 hypothetical protein FC96_GL001349 [Secundilactobacillus kimchicus JCM 15530]MBT9671777.1 VRR-NUC domain-containing protein [Secundilactobacillus kimchicus]
MQIENDIEKYLNQQAKKFGWLSLKFVSPGNAGVPDRILIREDGLLVFVELKRSAEFNPRPLQQHWLDKLNQFRQRTAVLCTKLDVNHFFLNWS